MGGKLFFRVRPVALQNNGKLLGTGKECHHFIRSCRFLRILQVIDQRLAVNIRTETVQGKSL